LEHFQEKWNPVFRPKMRQRKRAFSGKVESGFPSENATTKNAGAVSVSGQRETALGSLGA
jgi:hypothetical protein